MLACLEELRLNFTLFDAVDGKYVALAEWKGERENGGGIRILILRRGDFVCEGFMRDM